MEQLFFAYELLDKAIGRMNLNYVLTTLANGSSVIDHCYVKVRMEKSDIRLMFYCTRQRAVLQVGKQSMVRAGVPLTGREYSSGPRRNKGK